MLQSHKENYIVFWQKNKTCFHAFKIALTSRRQTVSQITETVVFTLIFYSYVYRCALLEGCCALWSPTP